MIEIYTASTPNGIKIPIAAEELGVPYELHMVALARGGQRTPAFLKINPNGRIPAIIDKRVDPVRGIPVFESGAILLHLGQSCGALLGTGPRARAATLGWLFLQVAGLGPNFGNAGYFLRHDPLNNLAIRRFQGEAGRHMALLDQQLKTSEWLNCESFSVADIAHFCWARTAGYAGLRLEDYGHVAHWVDRISQRPAVRRAFAAMGG